MRKAPALAPRGEAQCIEITAGGKQQYPGGYLFSVQNPSKLVPLAKRNALFRPKLMQGKNMKHLNDKLILRAPADLRPAHQLKLNTIFRLILIVLLGSAGLSARADLQKGRTAYDRGDYATALREWKPLAEQGDALAQTSLGLMYVYGRGVPQDDKMAAQWYTRAAEQGLALAQNGLGLMYEYGRGVPQDDKVAAQWYTHAAEQGDASAQNNLGLMYDNGKGVPEDDRVAEQWYTRAAEQGYADAQYNLGVMYAKGEGVPQDYVYAYMWANIAASGDSENAGKTRDALEKKMTPSQIAEAQKLARECVRKQYKDC